MIISASRRTDIPCFYSDWFMNRVNAGCVMYRNPMNHNQLHKILLNPDTVDCFVFWTKDSTGMIDNLKALDDKGFNYCFQFTLTPYGRDIERGLRDKSKIESGFMLLSKTIGREKVLWRYDPILLHGEIDTEYHRKHFERLCAKLCDFTEGVTISFVDNYAKFKTDFAGALSEQKMYALAEIFSRIAERYNLDIRACCEKLDLSSFNIRPSACIDKNLIEKICKHPLKIKADKNQRNGCGCCASVDIGTYNTCLNGCVYCYANHSESSVMKNADRHSKDGELLIGDVGAGDKIYERKV